MSVARNILKCLLRAKKFIVDSTFIQWETLTSNCATLVNCNLFEVYFCKFINVVGICVADSLIISAIIHESDLEIIVIEQIKSLVCIVDLIRSGYLVRKVLDR